MEGKAQKVYLFRGPYTTRSSHGHFIFENDCDRFSYTLEDTVRADGIKVYKETAIKGGTEKTPEWYNLSIHHSSKFGRNVIMLSNTTKVHVIKHGNVVFEYIYVHGGNKHKDSLGCILTAKNRNLAQDTIQGTMEKAFFTRVEKMLKKGPVRMGIINLPQNK